MSIFNLTQVLSKLSVSSTAIITNITVITDYSLFFRPTPVRACYIMNFFFIIILYIGVVGTCPLSPLLFFIYYQLFSELLGIFNDNYYICHRNDNLIKH